MPRPAILLVLSLMSGGPVLAQAPRIAPPRPAALLDLRSTPTPGARREGSGLPLTGMAIGAGLLGIPTLLCAIDGKPDGDYFDCNLRSILGMAVTGALLGGLVEGLLAPAQPRDTSAIAALPAALRRDLTTRIRRDASVPWIGLVLGGALGWGLVNAFCDTEDPRDNCGSQKLQVALVGALIGGTVDLFVRD